MTQPLSSSTAPDLPQLGGFFAVDTYHERPLAPWQPMSSLTDDSRTWARRVEQVQNALQSPTGPTIEHRVAASVAQLGLTARLIAPGFLAALGGQGWDVGLASLYWQPLLGGPFPLALPAARDGGSHSLHPLLDGPIAALVQATLEMSVSERVLWGNVASALHSTAKLIVAAEPTLAEATDDLLAATMARAELANTGHGRADLFQRHSCCLIYRIDPVGPRAVCGDCVLSHPNHRPEDPR